MVVARALRTVLHHGWCESAYRRLFRCRDQR